MAIQLFFRLLQIANTVCYVVVFCAAVTKLQLSHGLGIVYQPMQVLVFKCPTLVDHVTHNSNTKLNGTLMINYIEQ